MVESKVLRLFGLICSHLFFSPLRLRAGVQVSRPAEGLSLLRWKTPIDEPVEVTEVEESVEKIYGDEED